MWWIQSVQLHINILCTCPLEGQCLSKSIIYKALVESEVPAQISKPSGNANNDKNPVKIQQAEYIGQASNTFKERFNNHQLSFKHEKYKLNTGLSKHIWSLKQNKISFKIKWSIITSAPTYHPSLGTCKLCISEKTCILRSDHKFPLNKKSELMNKCRHREKFLLSSISNDTWFRSWMFCYESWCSFF